MREACYDCLKAYGNQRDHILLDRHDAKHILTLLLNGQGVERGEVFRSDSEAPSGSVRAMVTTSQGIIEGEFKILRWAKEGKRLGVKVKGVNPLISEIKISDEDLESGRATILLC